MDYILQKAMMAIISDTALGKMCLMLAGGLPSTKRVIFDWY